MLKEEQSLRATSGNDWFVGLTSTDYDTDKEFSFSSTVQALYVPQIVSLNFEPSASHQAFQHSSQDWLSLPKLLCKKKNQAPTGEALGFGI